MFLFFSETHFHVCLFVCLLVFFLVFVDYYFVQFD